MGVLVACVAISNDPKAQTRLKQLEKAREMTNRAKTQDITPVPSSIPDNPDIQRLENILTSVQELMKFGWNVSSLSTEGIITLRENDVVWQCGALDATPGEQNDDSFRKFENVGRLADQLQIELPSKTLVIWEGNAGYMDGDGGAERVDTDSLVWACPEFKTLANE